MKAEREKLEEALALQESLRGKVDDAIIEATIAALREKIADLEIRSEFPELQRKQVTIFFADIADSTRIVQHMDPEDVQEIILGAIKRIAEPVREYEGEIIRYMGDGFLAIFGLPQSHEDDPERAIRAGLSAVAIAKQLAPDLEQRWSIENFNIRIGINTGLVAVSSFVEEYTLMGSAVNLAARLETHAQSGGILISHDTFRHVRGVFTVEALDPMRLKGFDEPIQTYRVLKAKPRAFRVPSRGVEGVETRMIGRDAELNYLQDMFSFALDEGEGGVITITGEAGIGKSRLLYEFQNWLEFQPFDITFFRGRAIQESQHIPFALMHDVFSFRFQIQDSDPLDMVHEKIEAGFGELKGMNGQQAVRAHLIGQLLGFNFQDSPHVSGVLDDPQQLHIRASAYLEEYFEELTRHNPCVLFLEDIHWADDSSLELISQISRVAQSNPMLIVCLARPIFYTRRPYWGEGIGYFHRLELNALTKRESRNLVAEILKKIEQVPVALRELVVSWAEGNPFYIEEMIKMMIENGVILVGQDSWQVVPDRLAQINVPATLTGVLQSRLDSLPHEERTSLRLAAVVGRVFWEEAVEYLLKNSQPHLHVSQDDGLPETLNSLRERELIYRREESTFVNTREYLFKHSLLRDVAYENIPKRERRDYHKITAGWLQEITTKTSRSEEYAALIADHYILAGQQEPAADWSARAGLRAKNQDALKEARSYLTQALELIPEDDLERRWDILLERDEILGILGDKEARLAEDTALVKIAEESRDDNKVAEAYYRKGSFLHNLGQYQNSIDACQKAVEAARRGGNVKLEILALGIAIVNYKNLGEIETATETAEYVLDRADEHLDDKTLAATLNNLATVYENQDIQKAIQLFERSVESSKRVGNHFFMVGGLLNIGYSYTMSGHPEKGVKALQQALELNKSIRSPRNTIYNQLNLGLAYQRLGEPLAAEDILQQAATALQTMEDPFGEAVCNNYLGLVCEQRQNHAAGKTHFETAKHLFEKIGSHGYTQDTRAGLARCELSLHNISAAEQHASELWGYLSEFGPEGMEFPTLAYLTCARVFQAVREDEGEMKEVLKKGYDDLIERAEKFSDQDWRETYLQAVPEHRAMIEMWNNNISKDKGDK